MNDNLKPKNNVARLIAGLSRQLDASWEEATVGMNYERFKQLIRAFEVEGDEPITIQEMRSCLPRLIGLMKAEIRALQNNPGDIVAFNKAVIGIIAKYNEIVNEWAKSINTSESKALGQQFIDQVLNPCVQSLQSLPQWEVDREGYVPVKPSWMTLFKKRFAKIAPKEEETFEKLHKEVFDHHMRVWGRGLFVKTRVLEAALDFLEGKTNEVAFQRVVNNPKNASYVDGVVSRKTEELVKRVLAYKKENPDPPSQVPRYT